MNMLSPGSWVYTMLLLSYSLFTYFWTAMQFHPEQIASDMKKNGPLSGSAKGDLRKNI